MCSKLKMLTFGAVAVMLSSRALCAQEADCSADVRKTTHKVSMAMKFLAVGASGELKSNKPYYYRVDNTIHHDVT